MEVSTSAIAANAGDVIEVGVAMEEIEAMMLGASGDEEIRGRHGYARFTTDSCHA